MSVQCFVLNTCVFEMYSDPDGGIVGWICRCVDVWMGGWVDGWIGGWVDGWICRCVDGWMGGWVDGWMNGRPHE